MQPALDRSSAPNAGRSVVERGSWLNALSVVLRRECDVWRVAPPVAAALFLMPFAVALVAAVALVDRGAYDLIVNEDGILEWVELVGYALAAAFGLALAWRVGRVGDMPAAVWFLLLGVGCFFIAGEEISWGQRLFGVQTPAGLAAINRQNETNVHNISMLRTLFHLAYLLIGFGGSIVVAVVRLSGWPRLSALQRLLPPLFLTSSFFLLFAYRLMRVAFDSYDRSAVGRYGEVTEFALAFGLSAYALLQLRRLVSASPGSM